MNLSIVQHDLIERIRAHGGRIERRPGGFWTAPGVPETPQHDYKVPDWHFGTNTVKALALRGVLVETKRQKIFAGSFVVEYELAPEWRKP